MYVETDRIFKRRDLFDSLEEIRKVSGKSGIVKMNGIKISINPIEDLWMFIEPYRGVEDFQLFEGWKNVIDGIYMDLPPTDEANKKLDKVYGESYDIILKKPDPLFELSFEPISKNPYGWDNYKLTFSGRRLCDFEGKHLAKALEKPNTYNSKKCCVCPEDFKNYCKDVTSILNKYSTSIPDNIRITK